jgi:hypothetical protein
MLMHMALSLFGQGEVTSVSNVINRTLFKGTIFGRCNDFVRAFTTTPHPPVKSGMTRLIFEIPAK